jgi:hypothetical protein
MKPMARGFGDQRARARTPDGSFRTGDCGVVKQPEFSRERSEETGRTVAPSARNQFGFGLLTEE